MTVFDNTNVSCEALVGGSFLPPRNTSAFVMNKVFDRGFGRGQPVCYGCVIESPERSSQRSQGDNKCVTNTVSHDSKGDTFEHKRVCDTMRDESVRHSNGLR